MLYCLKKYKAKCKTYINYAETCTKYHVALYSRLLRFDFSLVAGATRPEWIFAVAVVRIACFFVHFVKKTPNSYLLIPNYLLPSPHPYADTSILLYGLQW